MPKRFRALWALFAGVSSATITRFVTDADLSIHVYRHRSSLAPARVLPRQRTSQEAHPRQPLQAADDAIQVLRRVTRASSTEDHLRSAACRPHSCSGTLEQLGLHTLIARNGRVRDLVRDQDRARVRCAGHPPPRRKAPSRASSRCSGSAPSISMSSIVAPAAGGHRASGQAAPTGKHAGALRTSSPATARWPSAGSSATASRASLQIVFGLLCTAEGCPVAVDLRGLDVTRSAA